ncbi:MAG: alpha/beta hydrolase [Alphaproteobacteria bacterium]
MLDRRTLLKVAAALAVAPQARADVAPPLPPVSDEPDNVIALWPKSPPGGKPHGLTEALTERDNPFQLRDRAVTGITRPTLSVFPARKPNGSAVLLVPGGGYSRVVVDKEGFETARLLAGHGISAFVLRYRLPADGWKGGADAPLQDAQRALRLVRSQAKRYAFKPERVGLMGFSAGGHVSISLSNRFDAKIYPRVDKTDELSARPDFAAYIYPVVTMGEGAHLGSREKLLGPAPAAERIVAYSGEQNVKASHPPAFLVHAADDDVVPVENSLKLFAALKTAKVRCEMHVFESGGHGFGLRGIAGNPSPRGLTFEPAWAGSHGML